MIDQILWDMANRNLIAKAIRELTYEEVLKPIKNKSGYSINNWHFQATPGIWGDLRVNPQTIENSHKEILAAEFFMDIQESLEIDDIVLANFLEELHNTLYADLQLLLKNKHVTVEEIAKFDGEEIQTYLHGHPKLILNKGRIGWGTSDHYEFAPESNVPITLVWAAVKKNKLKRSEDSFEGNELNAVDKLRIDLILKEKQLIPKDYFILPFHPWQWERFITIQFASSIAANDIVPLGEFGDLYQPQISLRTLRNVSDPSKPDIKLPLTILNTSAIRGLSSKYAKVGTALSELISSICQNDSILNKTEVLKEIGSAFYEHDQFKKIKKAPYRYHEYIGAIWRESSLSKVKENEKIILTGSLVHQDSNGQALISEIIKSSGLSTNSWIQAYTKHVIIPLYHLQIKYGIGLVSHGQNVMLRLHNFVPVGLIIKDFQGDLRFSNDEKFSFDSKFDTIERLPPHYLIHDLITGHFVTLVRYISGLLADEGIVNEREFYRVMAQEIKSYHQQYGENVNVSLLRTSFERVLVNKVRFEIGYADSEMRPKPILGSNILNPLTGEQNAI